VRASATFGQKTRRSRSGPVLRVGDRYFAWAHTVDLPLEVDPRGLGGMDEPFDGVVEIWWDSMDRKSRCSTPHMLPRARYPCLRHLVLRV